MDIDGNYLPVPQNRRRKGRKQDRNEGTKHERRNGGRKKIKKGIGHHHQNSTTTSSAPSKQKVRPHYSTTAPVRVLPGTCNHAQAFQDVDDVVDSPPHHAQLLRRPVQFDHPLRPVAGSPRGGGGGAGQFASVCLVFQVLVAAVHLYKPPTE